MINNYGMIKWMEWREIVLRMINLLSSFAGIDLANLLLVACVGKLESLDMFIPRVSEAGPTTFCVVW